MFINSRLVYSQQSFKPHDPMDPFDDFVNCHEHSKLIPLYSSNSKKKRLNLLRLEYSCGLCFQLHSCLFVRLIISDFLLSLLVFVRSPPHISSAAFSQHQRLPSLEKPSSAADDLRFAQDFWVFSLRLGDTGCALLVLLPHWSNPILSALWLVRSSSGGWSVGVVGGVSRAAKLLLWAYLCLHSHRQPAQVLTLGGDY